MNSRTQRGFSMIELMFVVAILVVITAFAIPKYVTMRQSFRIDGDSRAIAGLVGEAKLRAAADFSHARVYAALNANTYHLEIWNKTSGCWQTEGDSHLCTVAGVSPVQSLSSGVTFGVGNVSSAPANTEPALAQAPICYAGYAGQTGNTITIANTACIEFNSRGVPSNPAVNGAPDATGAFYVTDGGSVYCDSLLASGLIQSWYAPNTSTATWKQR